MTPPTPAHWTPDATPAATVVLLRDGAGGPEALMLLRDRALAFAGGTWVFPGGRIDAAEIEAAGGDLDVAAANAAVREAHEECGLEIDSTTFRRWSHWTPPYGQTRRFTTAFFVAPAPAGEVVVDDGEIRAAEWMTPLEVLRRRAAGTLALTPPTFVTLTQLVEFGSVAEIMAAPRPDPVEHFNTTFTQVDGALISLWQGDIAYPAGDVTAEGPRHRLWMTETEWRYERTEA